MKVNIFGIITLLCVCFGGGSVLAQNSSPDLSISGGESSTKYGYYYKGELVTLNPSKRLVAIEEERQSFNAFVSNNNLTKDPLSDHEALTKHGLGLYRLPAPKDKTTNQLDPHVQIRSAAQTSNQIIQPVFEQGPALLIPSDEVIIGFKEDTTLDEAQIYLSPHMSSQGIVDLSAHRKNTYILKITDPVDGRVYQVCRFLTGLEAISFAEPNHIIIMLPEPEIDLPHDAYPKDKLIDPQSSITSQTNDISLSVQAASSPAKWKVLINENFDNKSLPTGWSTGRYLGYSVVSWSVTNYRSHSGTGSCYASGGWTEGVPPPGPYPNNVKSFLDTPALDLASYEEVYVQLWFYARYQNPTNLLYDFGSVIVFDTDSGMGILYRLAIAYTGDLTADPTTDKGWRRALFRVPPSLRLNGVKVRFLFESNSSIANEGLYIDQVRVLGTTDVDTASIGNDTYGSRQYELKNMGQIAGLGNDKNDMNIPAAWALLKTKGHNQPVSPDIKVAVIDSGVDLDHPDLNPDVGYDSDGSIGGDPRTGHGTAVAGNIGAIRNNSIGVIGTAPNAKILPIFFGSKKGVSNASLAAAINVAVTKGAQILNNSWGWVGAPSQTIENAINAALDAGKIILFCAGNGPDREPWKWDVWFPCNLTGSTDVICVGATSPTDEHKDTASSDGKFGWGSSYIGDGPDICAPGPWSYTTDITGAEGYNDGSQIDPGDPSSADYTHDFGGTSSSTPKVAGIVALMLTADPDLTPKEVKRILRETADDIEATGLDDKTGAGRVDAFDAVFYVLYRPRTVTESASHVTPRSAVLNGVVNPNGFNTTYYFEHGQDTTYGYRTSAINAGSGNDDISVDARVAIGDENALYHFRLVAENSAGISFGRDKTYGYDTDADSLPDEWERTNFGDLSQKSGGDYDRDGLTNIEEYNLDTDPTNSDTDSDGILDGRDAFPNDPNEWNDADGDGIGDNADPDADNDGMPDGRMNGKSDMA
jgi:hypothetical protein